jgi:hypothetical protein
MGRFLAPFAKRMRLCDSEGSNSVFGGSAVRASRRGSPYFNAAYPAFDIAHFDTVANPEALGMILRVEAGCWVA